MDSGQCSNNGLVAADAEAEPQVSVVLTSEQTTKVDRLGDRSEEGKEKARDDIPRTTVVRALIEVATQSVEFIGVARLVHGREKAERQSKRRGAGRKVKKGDEPIVVRIPLNETQRGKLEGQTAFAIANKVPCSMGTVIRALIEMTEPSPEFSRRVKELHEREVETWREKRKL